MVGVRVTADIAAARGVLRRYIELAGSPTALMESAGAILENSVRERFRTSRGPGGIPWRPSGRQRVEARPGRGMGPNPGGRTLVDTGGLESSITHRVEARAVEVGVIAKTPSARHAAVHQFGATIVPKRGPYLVFRGADGHLVFARSVTIPARPFIGVDDDDRADLLAVWREQLEALSNDRPVGNP